VAQTNLTFQAQGVGVDAWPAVQVLFVLETTPYDGVFDPSTGSGGWADPCAGAYGRNPNGPLCDESNGVPFFVANAASIAQSLQLAHPSTAMSFGLVDYGASDDQYDDSNGSVHPIYTQHNATWWNLTTNAWRIGADSVYHVDIGDFVSADQFGPAVHSTFQDEVLEGGYSLAGSNLSTNILDSDSITALYGALAGVGLNWSDSTHHVIVWIGSTAPKDPAYVQNYCVSDSYWSLWAFPVYASAMSESECLGNSTTVTSPSCEPSFQFLPNVSLPECFGWVRSQNLNSSASIAGFAQDSPECSLALGGGCTIDTVDLFATPTDGDSLGWSTVDGAYPGVRPNGSDSGEWWPMMDAHRVISAGCDLANATGGTWAGPAIDNCGPDRTGTIVSVPFGQYYYEPNTSNPSLFSALEQIGLGSPPAGLVALGQSTPMFTFVPFGNFRVDLAQPVSARCESSEQSTQSCQSNPTLLVTDGVTYLAWNWSTNPLSNDIYAGDVWVASFYLVATGPPFGTPVPVDSCVTLACTQNGSTALGALFSQVSYQPSFVSGPRPSPVTTSFPPALVIVEATSSQTPVTSVPNPPPPPGHGLPGPSPIPSPYPVSIPITVANGVVATSVSAQAVAGGILGAGLTRVILQRRAIAQGQPVGNLVKPKRSAFEEERPSSPRSGRVE
jgi:hypothetical protein